MEENAQPHQLMATLSKWLQQQDARMTRNKPNSGIPAGTPADRTDRPESSGFFTLKNWEHFSSVLTLQCTRDPFSFRSICPCTTPCRCDAHAVLSSFPPTKNRNLMLFEHKMEKSDQDDQSMTSCSCVKGVIFYPFDEHFFIQIFANILNSNFAVELCGDQNLKWDSHWCVFSLPLHLHCVFISTHTRTHAHNNNNNNNSSSSSSRAITGVHVKCTKTNVFCVSRVLWSWKGKQTSRIYTCMKKFLLCDTVIRRWPQDTGGQLVLKGGIYPGTFLPHPHHHTSDLMCGNRWDL